MNSLTSYVTFPVNSTPVFFQTGMRLRTSGTLLEVAQIQGQAVTLKNLTTAETKQTQLSTLFAALQQGQITVAQPDQSNIRSQSPAQLDVTSMELRAFSQAAVKRMLAVKTWLNALRDAGVERIVDEPWVRTAIQKLKANELNEVECFKPKTLARYARRLQIYNGDWTKLIPSFSARGGAGKLRTHGKVNEIVDKTIAKFKQERGRIIKKSIYQSVVVQVQEYNHAYADQPIPLPSQSTVFRRIDQEFSRYELCARRHGSKYANRVYRRNAEARDKAERPLLVAEYDDLDSGVFLVDGNTGLPFGRGFITHGVDQSEDVPLGYSLGHVARSYESAMAAIACSLMPKDRNDPQFADCKFGWEPFGHPGQILMDNARYNTGAAMSQQSEQLALMLAGARAYGPTEKSSIERFNRVCKQDFLHTLPGWRGDKLDPDAVKEGLTSAIITVEVFERLYCKWVTDGYLNKPSADGWTYRQRWLKHFAHHSPTIRWSHDQLAILRLRPSLVTFRDSGGILRNCLRYSSDALYKLREKLGARAEVTVLTDHSDLSYLYVIDPTTRAHLRVPCVSSPRAYRGLSEYQHTLIQKMARDRGIKNPSLKDLVEAREALRELTFQLAKSRKMKDRKRAMRTGPVPDSTLDADLEFKNDNRDLSKLTPRVVTELEYSISQLALVSLDEGEQEGWVIA